MVVRASDESFTFMTPQGHMLSGTITFVSFEEDGDTPAEVQALVRTSDPLWEIGFRLHIAHDVEDEFWRHTLTNVAEYFGAAGQDVVQQTLLVDRKVRWSQVGNTVHNPLLRSAVTVHVASRPHLGKVVLCMTRESGNPYRASRLTPDAAVVGAGPNGFAAAIELAARGPQAARLRGRGDGRRRHAFQRADAARLHPRRLLGHPSARRSRRPSSVTCRWRSTAWRGSTRPRPSPIRWTTARPSLIKRSVDGDRRAALGRGRRGATGA